MNQQNAQEGLAPFDDLATMLAKAQEEFAVARPNFAGQRNTKIFYENVVNGKAVKFHSCAIRAGEMTIEQTRQWLDQVQAVADTLGVEPSIGGDYDATIEAYFHKRVPYEPEEVELAKHLLETGQYEEPPAGLIRWREPIPFSQLDKDE